MVSGSTSGLGVEAEGNTRVGCLHGSGHVGVVWRSTENFEGWRVWKGCGDD